MNACPDLPFRGFGASSSRESGAYGEPDTSVLRPHTGREHNLGMPQESVVLQHTALACAVSRPAMH